MVVASQGVFNGQLSQKYKLLDQILPLSDIFKEEFCIIKKMESITIMWHDSCLSNYLLFCNTPFEIYDKNDFKSVNFSPASKNSFIPVNLNQWNKTLMIPVKLKKLSDFIFTFLFIWLKNLVVSGKKTKKHSSGILNILR